MAVSGSVKAGKIAKAYGLRGSVHVILNPAAAKRIQEENPLFIDLDGQRVPYFVEELNVVSDDQAIIKFEWIDDVEKAKSIAGSDLYLDPESDPVSQPGNEGLQEIKGYKAYDRSTGYLGTVEDFLEHELNPVILVDHKGRELMVPAAGEIILEVDHGKRTILFDLPEGLTSL